MPRQRLRLSAISLSAIAVTASLIGPVSAQPAHDITSPDEARRVDTVDVSGLQWVPCDENDAAGPLCASLEVPMDYDKPDGEKYQLRLAKMAATDPSKRVGSLFVNPGGPGGSAVSMVERSHRLPEELRQKFDIVGVDPRGIGGSQLANCFGNIDDLNAFRDQKWKNLHPINGAEITAATNEGRKLAEACNTYNAPILKHMSTAEVARDMDVVRRAVGDDKLTYLGLSYGTHIGQVYANIFPDRVRALALDGVVNGADWAGVNHNSSRNQDRRLFSAMGAEGALKAILAECTKAGATHCEVAPTENNPATAQERFDVLFAGVKEKERSVDYDYDEDGVVDYTERVRYDLLAGELLSALYSSRAPEQVSNIVAVWENLLAMAKAQEAGTPAPAMTHATRNYLETKRHKNENRSETVDDRAATYLGVACSDGFHPNKVANNAMQAWDAQTWSPTFGQIWAWSSVPCSPDSWRAKDAHTYTGDFRAKPANPLLFIGNTHDPATYYRQATFAARRSPGAGLVLANNYGHTALGASACATKSIVNYLVSQDMQPFTECNDAPAAYPEPLVNPAGARRDITSEVPGQELVVPLQPLGLLLAR